MNAIITAITMAVIKPKDMPPFWVLSVFGGSYKGYKHSERLTRLFMEIEFKFAAVSTALELLLTQEEIIKEKHAERTPSVRSYKDEIKQMAYLGFFLDAVYALTEKISHVTKIFHDGLLKDGFNKQRNDLLENPKLNPFLANLLDKLNWYDLFREVRVEHSHYGTSILAFGYDKGDPQTGYSQLILEIAGKGKRRVLIGTRYTFDLRKTKEIKKGIEEFIQKWSLVLLKKLGMNTTISGIPNQKNELTLREFMEGRE